MLQKVTIPGIELPRLYIAENHEDALLAKKTGIPYIRWTKGCDTLIKMLLRPTLESMFPHIKWDNVLGIKNKFTTKVNILKCNNEDYEGRLDTVDVVSSEQTKLAADEPLLLKSYYEDEDGVLTEDAKISEGTRICSSSLPFSYEKLSLADYIGDMTACVDLEILQRLQLMPKFIGDIMDCIKINQTSNVHWQEGYNKKIGCTIGNFNRSTQLPNLIILDVSGSIPRGISATMIALIDTLRTQLSADLIITSSISRFYPAGSELPDPENIRDMFGYGNETSQFFDILTEHVQGKHYGNVISFGDNDTPDYEQFELLPNTFSLKGTKVEAVHHYHTGMWGQLSSKTGYAKWCHHLSCTPREEYDTSWVKSIKKEN